MVKYPGFEMLFRTRNRPSSWLYGTSACFTCVTSAWRAQRFILFYLFKQFTATDTISLRHEIKHLVFSNGDEHHQAPSWLFFDSFAIHRVSIKSTPSPILLLILLRIFAWNFTQPLHDKRYTLSPRFVEICAKMTKKIMMCLNEDNPDFSVFRVLASPVDVVGWWLTFVAH